MVLSLVARVLKVVLYYFHVLFVVSLYEFVKQPLLIRYAAAHCVEGLGSHPNIVLFAS